jgi:PPK2 family polyphosphate:nucleotide phosphotransferase
MKPKDMIERYRVPARGGFTLSEQDPSDRIGRIDKSAAESQLAAMHVRLNELQHILYAQSKHAVLVVLQAMDTGGKDGAIRHVFGPLNPQGVQVSSFKAPTSAELAHDYLWRIHQAVPAKGTIRIFNRSHYEDVLVVRVRELAPRRRIEQRYRQINDFERHLYENDVTIIKFFLHISKEEQRKRLQARLDDPAKHWKFCSGDLAERQLWEQYQEAYELALRKCSTTWAPWYVVPADRKWYRNLVIAGILLETLESLKMSYPPAEPGLEGLKIDQ